MLKMDGHSNHAAQELIMDIFRDLDRNNDGIIKKSEFVISASQCKALFNLLIQAAEKEQEKVRCLERAEEYL